VHSGHTGIAKEEQSVIFGYSTNAFVKSSVFQAVEKIARLGFRGVEIMCDRPHLYPPDFGPQEMARLQRLIQSHGLRVTNLNSFTLFAVGDTYLPSWIEPERERREIRIRHTLDCLRLAHVLGCGNISVPPGGPLGGLSRKEAFRLFHEGLERVAPVAEDLGVKVLVEPEPDLLMENTGQFRAFMREVRSPAVGLNFDMGHFFCAGEDPSAAFEELLPWVGHVHLEDIASSRVHKHLIPGRGAIPFLEVLRTMVRLGYRGDISLELYPYVDMPEEAGRESLQYLRPIFREAGLEVGPLSPQS
jgi:sugar phosphate isomerase/epimerase